MGEKVHFPQDNDLSNKKNPSSDEEMHTENEEVMEDDLDDMSPEGRLSFFLERPLQGATDFEPRISDA